MNPCTRLSALQAKSEAILITYCGERGSLHRGYAYVMLAIVKFSLLVSQSFLDGHVSMRKVQCSPGGMGDRFFRVPIYP